MDIRTDLQFNGTWRVYQQRVLDNAGNYLEDGKVHIVAAPGSGKTTLGIELIHRLGKPCLILAPSITIRDQWLIRIKDAFLPNTAIAEELLSNNIRKPAPITAITYQALHSCMSQYKGTLVEKEDGAEEEKDEEVDFSGFDFFQVVSDMGYGTVCLDEAHHLRSEWWKALEEMMKKMSKITLISLTATPPYDSTPQQWERYISLCGPIDEEIIVPELVKEGSLCPHQDYVYFNMPTTEEKEVIKKFREETNQVADEIYEDAEFTRIISSHPGLRNPKEYTEQFLENPKYLSSILIFLNSKNIPFSKELTKMLGTDKKLPDIDIHWMEALLQGFIYDDRESYFCDQAYVDSIESKLRANSCIFRNKVQMVASDSISKLLRTSKGKINSIIEIVKAENKNLGTDLRMLILTDYIKKDFVSAIGDEDKSVNELGVVPIFENIRRNVNTGLELGVLSGTVVIIPARAKVRLEQMMEERGLKAAFKECSVPEYYQFSLTGSETTEAALVTELFQAGYIQVLIGTKSLLGEGWDSPCINSLILASFVGSFMLSNQMRGRAIRTMKGNPDKVSNIWHLVCMEPEISNGIIKSKKCVPEASEDYQMLKRRFEGFLGLDYEEDVIENGTTRLTFIKEPYIYSEKGLQTINTQMLSMAKDRRKLKARWEKALVALKKMEVVNETSVDKEHFEPGALFGSALALMLLYLMLNFVTGVTVLVPMVLGSTVAGEFGALAFVILAFFFVADIAVFITVFLVRFLNIASPYRHMKKIGEGILKALQEEGSVSLLGRKNVKVEDAARAIFYTYLEGGTEREKDVYAKCIYEFFDVVDNQRYLLKAKSFGPKPSKYYCVPELFGKRKEDAELFYKHIKKYLGKYDLIYTRSAEGRKILLDARVHSFANKNERRMDALAGKRKRVKSVFE